MESKDKSAESKTPMTKDDSSRIQSSQEKGGHDTGKGSFAARAQSAGDKYSNTQEQSKNK